MKKNIKNAIDNLNQDTSYQIFDLGISVEQKNMLSSIKTFGGEYQDNYNKVERVLCAFKPDNYAAVQSNITISLENIFDKLNTHYSAGNDNASIQEFISYSHDVANAFISANSNYHISQNAKQVILAINFNNERDQNAFRYHVDHVKKELHIGDMDDSDPVIGPRILYSMVGNSTLFKKNNALEVRQKFFDAEKHSSDIIIPKTEFLPKDGDHHKADSGVQAAVDFSSTNSVTVYPAIHSGPKHNAEEVGNGRVFYSISFSNLIHDISCDIQGETHMTNDEL